LGTTEATPLGLLPKRPPDLPAGHGLLQVFLGKPASGFFFPPFLFPHLRLGLSQGTSQPQKLLSSPHSSALPVTARNGEETGDDMGETASLPTPFLCKALSRIIPPYLV